MEDRREAQATRHSASPMDEQSIVEGETRAKWETLRPSFLAWAAQNGESLSLFDEIVEGQVEFARVRYQKKGQSSN